jgi:signal transduction histidine kinase
MPVVLVIDDDEMQRFLYREALEPAGFEIVEADGGTTAIAIFGEVGPDVVLLDVLMPGMNGFDTCRAVRAMPLGTTTPILMATGLDDIESIELSYQAGATDFISKPINWALLPHRVRYALRADEMLTSLETARDKAQAADRAKTAFLAAMSHEFRTPLNAIIGFAEIISKQVFGQIANERYLEASRNILEAGERLSNTTTDVLTIAQLESGSYPLNRDAFDLCALVRSVLSSFSQDAAAIGREVRFDAMAESIEMFGDERAVQKMLFKLLSNAAKFSGEKTPISVILDYGPDGDCRLTVEDQGLGMSAEEVTSAVQPFQQVDNRLARIAEGTGLGLSITQKLIEAHNGNLGIVSVPMKGTRVTLNFKSTAPGDAPRFVAGLPPKSNDLDPPSFSRVGAGECFACAQMAPHWR